MVPTAYYTREEKLSFARRMRANPTASEKRLWDCLRSGQQGAYFHRQILMRGWILDFYCRELRLAIEVDGDTHNWAKDKVRDSVLLEMENIVTLRFKNEEVWNRLDAVCGEIQSAVRRIRRGW